MQEKPQKRILVIGSFITDLVFRVDRYPEEGETLIGHSFQRFPGGKGANQAMAAARLGARVAMVGRLGVDEFGDEQVAGFEAAGIDTYRLPNVSLEGQSVTLTLDDGSSVELRFDADTVTWQATGAIGAAAGTQDPYDAVAVRAGLAKDAAFVARLRAALDAVGPALKHNPNLLPPRYTGFVSKDNAFYRPIRDAGLASGQLQAK